VKIVEQDVRVRGAEGHAGGNLENDMEEPADPVPQKPLWLSGVVALNLKFEISSGFFYFNFSSAGKERGQSIINQDLQSFLDVLVLGVSCDSDFPETAQHAFLDLRSNEEVYTLILSLLFPDLNWSDTEKSLMM